MLCYGEYGGLEPGDGADGVFYIGNDYVYTLFDYMYTFVCYIYTFSIWLAVILI